MKMAKIKNIVNVILKITVIIFIMQVVNVPISNASLSDIITDGDSFIQEGKEQGSTIDEYKLKNTSDIIYNILLSIGVGLSVIIGAVLGIQIMWGSIEQKTKAKEALMPYIIGCIVIFGAFGIWKICVTVLSQI